jgi:PAS domain S-box-containing protein
MRRVRGHGRRHPVAPRRALATMRASEERFRFLARASDEVVWEWDLARDRIFWGDNLAAVVGHPPERLDPEKAPDLRGAWARWDELIHPDDRERARASLDLAVGRRDEFWVEEYRFRHPDGYIWLSERDCLLYDGTGRLTRMIGALRVVTERKEAEERQRLLLLELSHRVNNTLAVVQSLAARSFADGRTTAEAREVFTRRLRALAAAHSLLTASEWRGAGLRAVVEAELAAHGPRTSASGPDLDLTPKAALALALTVHELATNAVKHGALSAEGGRVEVAWRVDPAPASAAKAALRLTWRELGGLPVPGEPPRRGFGRVLLEQGLRHELGGDVVMEFRADGLRWELRLPADAALAAA